MTITGYLYQCDLYTGRKVDTEHGWGEGVVYMLTRSMKDLYCQVYVHNFFNRPSPQKSLLREGIYSCGTVRQNRKFMPKSLEKDKNMNRGDIDYVMTNDISCVKWMDNRSVLMISNFVPPTEKTVVKRRKTGTAERVDVNCPKMMELYNNTWEILWIKGKLPISMTGDPRQNFTYMCFLNSWILHSTMLVMFTMNILH